MIAQLSLTMVVESLLAFLRSHPSCKAVFKLREVAIALRKQTGKPTELVCDAVPVVLWLLAELDITLTDERQLPSYSCLYGGDFHKYAERVAVFVKALRHLDTEPVFFLPAAAGCDKTVFSLSFSVLKARYLKSLERITSIQQICDGSGDFWRVSRTLQPLVLLQAVMTLTSLNVRTVQCVGHSCAEMVAYASSNTHVFGILSTNSDLAVIDASVFIDTKDFDLQQSLALHSTSPNETPNDVLCAFVTTQSVARAIGIRTEQLADLAILCGNDYTRELNQQLQLCDYLQLKDLTVTSVAQWLVKQKTSKLTNPSFLMPPNPQYQEAVRESYTLYSGDYVLPPNPSSLCQYLLTRILTGKLNSSMSYAGLSIANVPSLHVWYSEVCLPLYIQYFSSPCVRASLCMRASLCIQ